MKFIKIKPFIAMIFITALVLSGCNALDMGDVNAAQKEGSVLVESSESVELTLGRARFYGDVTSISAEKIQVDDVVFRVDANSVLSGSLTQGDSVQVDAILLPDQSRYAVVVKAQSDSSAGKQSSELEFKLYGQVDGMGSESWVVSEEVIYVDARTQIENGIALSDLVEVEGYVVDGKLLAREIKHEDSLSGLPVGTPIIESTPGVQVTPATTATSSLPSGNEIEFYGKLEAKNGNTWVVAGQTITILPQTEIKGNLVVGDLVKVHAWRQADGSLLTREIEKADDDKSSDMDDDHELKGTITSINGNQWMVAGVLVLIDSFTRLDSGLQVGDYVKVEGYLQGDGSFLAKEIESEDDQSSPGSDDDMDDDSNDDSDDDDSDDDDSDDDDSDDDDDDDDDNDDDDDDDDKKS